MSVSVVISVGACGSGDTPSQHFAIAGAQYSETELTQFKLPKRLQEISGLAFDPQQRLYAHNDEKAIVYQIDHISGRIVDHFELEGGVRDDFEGIAATDDYLYLVNSRGTIYEAARGTGGAEVAYTRFKSKLPCEVEGLVHDSAGDRLIVACKNFHAGSDKAALRLHVWSIATKAYLEGAAIEVDRSVFERQGIGPLPVQVTGIEITSSGNFLILAGRAHMLLELSPAGVPRATAYLPMARHPQTEGIALSPRGELLLADEAGSKSGSQKTGGRLSVYQPIE